MGRAKYQTFAFLKDRVWKKLQGSKGTMLSKAGKEVLIKAIAQAIATYTMGVFQLPMKLCNELNSLCAKFWWGQVGNDKKIHWKSWDCLTQPKKEGGMGFRDLRYFNLAMLAKQGWRLLKNQESLLFKCFKARYFPRCNFLHANDSPNSSFVWKSMMAALPILRSGCCWRVGNGESIDVTKDKWIPNYPSNKLLHPVIDMDEDWKVSNLINWDLHGWRRDILMAKFNRDEAEVVCRIPLSQWVVEDSMVWLYNRRGVYTVRFGYHLARQVLRVESRVEASNRGGWQLAWRALWKLKLMGKIKIFGWRACHDVLPTQVNLAKRKIISNTLCHCCKSVPEDTLHVIWGCDAAQDVWTGSLNVL